jgi:hypothetical protein
MGLGISGEDVDPHAPASVRVEAREQPQIFSEEASAACRSLR